MKNTVRISGVILLILSILLIHSCKKDTATLPILTTNDISTITQTTATSGGNISNDGGETIISRGVCWSTNNTPTLADNKTLDGAGAGSFVSAIAGLTAGTTYYVRAYATNSAGTAYGNEIRFTTNGTITDIEGNVYKIIQIGNQVWMVENLRVTHYSNGDPITKVTNGTTWSTLTTGAYCDYDNTPSNSTTYGKIYNWYTVQDSRKLCPTGWHVPLDSEWTLLTDYLGGESVAGGKLKEIGTIHWQSPNSGATNESGFTALPGGHRDYVGAFKYLGSYGSWWSATESRPIYAWYRFLDYDFSNFTRNDRKKQLGFSVRCLKD